MLYIVIGTALTYIVSMMDTTGTFMTYLMFNPALILRGQIWRLVTFIFIPSTEGLVWVAFTLYFYYSIGSALEYHWGTGRFTLYYLCGMLMTIIFSLVLGLVRNSSYMLVDGWYINLSLFFAFATLFPDERVLFFFIIPIKIKWMALLSAVLFIMPVFTSPFPESLLPLIAIANYFLFCGGDLIDYIKHLRGPQRKSAVNFRREVQRIKYEQRTQEYRHKCAVCGKTDTEYPNLDFRYCSRCNGYHCFCEEHINNHVHFQ